MLRSKRRGYVERLVQVCAHRDRRVVACRRGDDAAPLRGRGGLAEEHGNATGKTHVVRSAAASNQSASPAVTGGEASAGAVEATCAVAAAVAAPEPRLFVAVTTTRIRAPTSIAPRA